MPKFILERSMDAAEFMHYREQNAQHLVQRGEEGNSKGEVTWLESIVTNKKIYDIYQAPEAEVMMDYASYQGLPIQAMLTITWILKKDQGKDEDSPEKML